jgi:hypothetical protein
MESTKRVQPDAMITGFRNDKTAGRINLHRIDYEGNA